MENPIAGFTNHLLEAVSKRNKMQYHVVGVFFFYDNQTWFEFDLVGGRSSIHNY